MQLLTQRLYLIQILITNWLPQVVTDTSIDYLIIMISLQSPNSSTANALLLRATSQTNLIFKQTGYMGEIQNSGGESAARLPAGGQLTTRRRTMNGLAGALLALNNPSHPLTPTNASQLPSRAESADARNRRRTGDRDDVARACGRVSRPMCIDSGGRITNSP